MEARGNCYPGPDWRRWKAAYLGDVTLTSRPGLRLLCLPLRRPCAMRETSGNEPHFRKKESPSLAPRRHIPTILWSSSKHVRNHDRSGPHGPETNGIAQRAARRIKDGASAVLIQSGLHESWWAESTKCYCYLRNIQDLLADGEAPYERRLN